MIEARIRRSTGGRDEPGRVSPLRQGDPVLLLHGFLSTRRALAALERRLLRDGFRVFTVELGGLAGRFNTRDIRELATVVRDEVERLCAREPELPPFTVIGHSKGGLIASWWVKHLGGHRRVRAVITLGTPHGGTHFAWAGIPFGWLAPSVVQMRPGSAFVRRLAEGAWPDHVRLLALHSRRDRIVSSHGAMVGPEGTTIRNVEVDGGHSDYLLRKDAYAAIVRELRSGAAPEARELLAA